MIINYESHGFFYLIQHKDFFYIITSQYGVIQNKITRLLAQEEAFWKHHSKV